MQRVNEVIIVALIGAAGAIIGSITGAVKVALDYKAGIRRTDELLTQLIGDVKEIKSNAKLNRRGIRDIARYRLQRDLSEALVRGWTTVEELRELAALYSSYHALGGNGAVSELYEHFTELPVRTNREE